MNYARILLIAAVCLAAGCAPTASGGGAQTPRTRQDVISEAEVRETHYTNLYDLVAAMRPAWLRTRGQISIRNPEAGQVVVYINGVRAGGAEYLRQVSPREVASLQYLKEIEAQARFGLQQNGGAAIIIRTVAGD